MQADPNPPFVEASEVRPTPGPWEAAPEWTIDSGKIAVTAADGSPVGQIIGVQLEYAA